MAQIRIFPDGFVVEDEYDNPDSRTKTSITELRFDDLSSDEITAHVKIRLKQSDKKMDGQLAFTPEQARQLGLFLLNGAESQSKKEAAA